MKHVINSLLLGGGLLLAPVAALWAQAPQAQLAAIAPDNGVMLSNGIVGIQSGEQGGRVFLRIDLRRRLEALPASFSISNPARIAFDFPGTANELGRSVQTFEQGVLSSANIVQAGDRTRLVLNLARSTPYQARLEGNSVIVELSPAAGESNERAIPSAISTFSANHAAQGLELQAIRDVQFRRGANGEGRVVVDLSSANTGIDIRRQGENLVVEFLNTQLPEHLRRRSDVTDFATPVTEFVTQMQGTSTRMVITPNGLWEHNAYQADKQFVIELRRMNEDPNKLVQGQGREKYNGEKLSLNFQNIDVRSVLQIFADFTDFNIVTSDSVTGSITLRLQDVPWDQALDIILQAKGLERRVDGKVIRIAPRAEFIEQDKQLAEARKAEQEKEQPITESFQINYHKVEDIAALILGKPRSTAQEQSGRKTEQITATPQGATGKNAEDIIGQQGQSILTKDSKVAGQVTYDSRSNRLYVLDYAEKRDAVRKLIAEVDVPPKQVMIEARIVEVQKGFARDLGVRLGFGKVSNNIVGRDADGNPISRFSLGGNSTSANAAQLIPVTPTVVNPQGWNVNLPASNPTSSLGMVLWNAAATAFIDLELSAAESDNRLSIVSRPRILTANQQVAEIRQGQRVPYQTIGGDGEIKIELVDVALLLSVRPRITPDGRVFMEVTITNDRVGQDTNAGQRIIDQQKITSEVLVENGGTVTLGGVVKVTENREKSQIPLLGDIPVVGNLFKRTLKEDSQTELMVFITPRIIDQQLGMR